MKKKRNMGYPGLWTGVPKIYRIMKLICLFMFVLLVQVSASTYSQNTKLNLSGRNLTIEQVLGHIEDQSEYSFFYNVNEVDLSKVVNVDARDQSIEEVLNHLMEGTGMMYTINNKLIVIHKSEVSGIVGHNSQQTKTISGKATDSSGAPLPGVTVVVKGTTNGTITDFEGNFKISNVSNEGILVFSFVGMKTQEIAISDKTSFNVAMEEDAIGIEEVVAVGYGTMRKSDLTGSLSSVKSKDLTAFSTISPQQALAGKAAGVYVMPKTGSPGGEINVRIRGTNSIQGSNEPLYVIDGFPFNGNPTLISNNDIESIEILKDASATAIYGSRGANGVVLITTKKGKSGKTRVEFDGSYSLQSIRRKLPLMNASEYAQMINVMYVNDGEQPFFQNLESFGEVTDWQDEVFQTAPLINNNISLSGGSDKTQFSVGVGYYDEEGIIRNSNYKRFSVRANINHKISDKFDFSISSNFSNVNSQRQNSGGGNRGGTLIGGIIGMPPTLAPYNEDGTLIKANLTYPYISDALTNPFNYINERSDNYFANRLLLNGALTYKPAKGLSVKFSGGLENDDNRTDIYTTKEFINSKGSASIGTNSMQSILSENIITYTKKLNSIHSFSATAGITYQNYALKSLAASGSNFVSDVPESFDLGAADSFGTPSSGFTEWTLLSYLGRFNYTLKDRYLFTASFRADGSSRYSEGEKWGYFPSGAFAWRVKEEKFMESLHFISDLKLRLGYGETGSTAISPYQTLNVLYSDKIILNDDLVTSYSPSDRMPAPLKWESTDQMDFGLDIGAYNNKLRLTLDYYIKNTHNLLNRVQLPSSTGYIYTTQNVGEMQNKGLELDLIAKILEGEFTWTASANIAFNRNKIKKLYNGQIIRGSTIGIVNLNDFVNILEEGRPLGAFYGYLEDGYDENGRIKFKDLDGVAGLSFDDKVQIGDPNPDFIGGINSTMTYKGFELNLFFFGSYGNDIYNISKAAVNMDYLVGLNKTRDILYDSWTPETPNAKNPKLSKNNPVQVSDRYVEDGSFLKLKNIQLAYNIPCNKWGIKWIENGQIYISGQDLLTFTKYSWYDPEVNSWGGSSSINIGIDHLSYPTSKGVTMGIKLGF